MHTLPSSLPTLTHSFTGEKKTTQHTHRVELNVNLVNHGGEV